MNKMKQFVSVFLVLALIIACFPNNSVYAQTEQTESNTEKDLPIDKSYRIKTTEGVESSTKGIAFKAKDTTQN